MRRYGFSILLLIVIIGLFAEGDFLWQDNGIPLIASRDVRWYGNSVELPDGGSIVVWTEMITDNHDLFGMRLNSDGQMVWDEPRLIFDDELPMFDEKITLSSNGYIYISWFTCGDQKLNLNRFDLEGNALWNDCYTQNSDMGYEDERVNRDLIPDQDGGVYLFWKDDWACNASRISDNGTPMWENPLQLFDEYDNASLMIRSVTDDGQNGFVASTYYYAGSGNYLNIIERGLPDGSSDWCVELPQGYDPMMKRTSDNELSFIYTENGESSIDDIYLCRINLDGELLYDDPVLLEEDIDYCVTSAITSDEDGNIFAGWSYRKNQENSVSIAKVTPDNQTCWQYTYTPEGGELSFDMRIGLDSSGNIYQSGLGSAAYGVNILKLNPNGELCWSTQIDGNPETYEGYINLVMNVDDEDVTLYWGDRRNNHQAIIQQKYHADGTPYFEEDGEVVRQSWNCGIDYLRVSDNGEPQDNLMFTWTNGYDNSSYMQRVDIDGDLGFDTPGLLLLTQMDYYDAVVSAYLVGDNYLTTWFDYSEDENHMFVNMFDQQGNRVWTEDLEIVSNGVVYDMPKTTYYNGVLNIYWLSYPDTWSNCIETQRVIDGEVVWSDPVVLCSTLDNGFFHIIDDYVFFNYNNGTYSQRLDNDGNPCEGWNAEGNRLDISEHNNRLWTRKTDSGLVIVWPESLNPRVQILHEDGTMEWENSLNLFPNTINYIYNISIADNSIYVLYYYQSTSLVQAFDFSGSELWDEPVELFPDFENIGDVEIVPDGLLITYTVYHSRNDYRYDLLVQHLDIYGNFWDEPMTACNSRGYRYDAEIIPATNNRYFITWLDARDVRPMYNLYGQLLDYQPNTTDDPTDIPTWAPNLSVYPNPFNPETTVQFSLPGDSKVDLRVYNVKGQLVRTLCNEVLPCGNHQIEWNGTDKSDRSVASGVYLINLNINGTDYRSKALLLK